MKKDLRKNALKSLIFAVFTSGAMVAMAQEASFPNKPIELVVPFGPGATSAGNFIVAKPMSKFLKQPVVVISKAGAGGALGSAQVASAKPDGYTLLAAVPAFVTLPLTEQKINYRVNDFIPVGQFARFNHYLVVNKNSPLKNLTELMELVKAKPSSVSYAGTGVGGTAYLLIETLKINRKLSGPLFIPYPSESGALQAVMANDIQFAVVSAMTAVSQIQSGAVKALAVFSSEHDPVLPKIETATEQGFPELKSRGYLTIAAPAKTPGAVIKLLEEAIEKSVEDKELQENLLKIGASSYFRNSNDVSALFESEKLAWSEMGKRVGAMK